MLFALILCAGCIADRNDALTMRDEALFTNLVKGEDDRDGRSPRETGRLLEDWAENFETTGEITLKDCFRLVLNNSEELQIRGEKLLVSWTYERESISSLLPKASLLWSYAVDAEAVKFGGQKVSPRDTTTSWISVQQKIFDGRSLAAVPAAKASKRIEELTLRDERDRLLFAAASGFYTVLGKERDILVFEASLDSATEFHRVLEARHSSGEASRQELLSALAQREEAKAQLIQSRYDRLIARSNLQRLVGLPSLPEILVDVYEVDSGLGEIPALVEAAIQDRPDLEAAKEAIEFAKAERLAALSEYLPSITADFTRYLKREGAFGNDVDWNLSFNLAWDLYDSGGREARQSRTLSQIRQQELTLMSLKKQIRHEVEEAVLSFHSLDMMMDALKSRSEASKAALELANAEYKANEATNLDVELARKVWQSAESDLERAKLSRKLAALKIRLVIGDFKVDAPLIEEAEIRK